MSNFKKIKYDWFTSSFYKEKNMEKWAENYLKNNHVDFDSLKNELQDLIYQDNLIGLNSFNMYGAFSMELSSLQNALLSAMIKASK